MEVKRLIHLFLCGLSVAFLSDSAICATTAFDVNHIRDVYVADFNSEDIEHCRPSDVDLSNSQARDFFRRARQVDSKILHDFYNYAPCYIEGVLKYKSQSCDWQIRAGATGQIKCGNSIWYFACDNCQDLFESQESK